jgi:hypothetical protein
MARAPRNPAPMTISRLLAREKRKYIKGAEADAGNPQGFRDYIHALRDANPEYWEALMLQGLIGNANAAWAKPPRNQGPDLFSIGGFTYAEWLTRPAPGHVPDGQTDIDENDENFEKVDQNFATIDDAYSDAMIKMRVAAQTSSRAERQMKATDLALRRAKGDRSARLADVADVGNAEPGEATGD